MANAAFARATKRVLARLGQDSLLRGVDGGKVNIEHGVEVGDPDTGAITQRDVATIMSVYSPKRGDLLEHPDGTYRLDRLIDDNEYSERYIVVKLP